MWKRTSVILSLALLSFSACYASSPTGPVDPPQTVTLNWSEYQTLNSNLITLQQNSTEQQNRITQLETLLQTASASTTKQKEQLQTLNTLLTEQNKQIEQTQISLTKANESLKTLETELKDKQQEARKNKVWAIVATGVAVYLVAK